MTTTIPASAPPTQLATPHNALLEGALFVALGTLIFSVTLPATRFASPALGGWTVGFGRLVIAGFVGALILILRREKLPTREQFRKLAVVILGVIFGFPILTSIALERVPANHGAVMTGIIPLVTAVFGIIRDRQRPPILFWVSCGIGVLAVILFAWSEGAGSFTPDDLLLFAAVTLAGFGYVEGGRLAREMRGWRVICWAVAISGPFAIVPLILNIQSNITAGRDYSAIPIQAVMGLLYLSVFSQILGFFAMYHGLAVGGVARVSLVQLVQPFLTLIWAALLLREEIKLTTALVAIMVIVNIGFSQWVWRRAAIRARRSGTLPLVADR
jgi:drug/metabolite transporter (DMT)-like permease